MTGTLMLDDTGDLIAAEWDDGAETVGVALGVQQVAQAAAIAVSVKQGSLWWNVSAGIDYSGLFYHSGRSDTVMNPVRSTALRQAILGIPGIAGFSGSETITFTRSGRTLAANIPCVEIDCDNTREIATIQTL